MPVGWSLGSVACCRLGFHFLFHLALPLNNGGLQEGGGPDPRLLLGVDVVQHKVGDVSVQGIAHVAVAQEVEAWVHFIQHVLDAGIAVPCSQGVSQAPRVAVVLPLFGADLFQLDVIVDAVDDGQGLGGAAAAGP